MSDDIPEPFNGPEVNCRGLDFMPLEVGRLRDSDLVAISSGDEFKAAVLLWAKSWNETPAGSLPSDDLILAKAAGYSPRVFSTLRETALRGWVLCSDGRLYHPLISDLAEKAWKMRRGQADRANSRWAKEKAKSAAKSAKPPSPRKSPDNAGAYAGTMQGTVEVKGKDSESHDSDASAVVAELRKYPRGEYNSWNMCLAVLSFLGGVQGSPARSFVGKLKSEFKLDDSGLAEIALATWAEKSGDPRAYMRQCAARKGDKLAEERTEGTEEERQAFLAEYKRQENELLRQQDIAGQPDRVRRFQRFGVWPNNYGPKPDEPGCKVEPEILREFGYEPKS